MTPSTALVLAPLVPLVGAVLIACAGRRPNLRDSVTLVTATLLFCVVCCLAVSGWNQQDAEVHLLSFLDGLSLGFHLEPLGLLFALVASGLWIVTSVYAIGYMRGHQERHQTRFFVCFAIAIAAAMGVALARNLITLFVFYEVLTLSTYPLVTHHGTPQARQAGRVYLGILLSTSIALLLLATLWTWHAAGTLDFVPGGILRGKIDNTGACVLLALFAFGTGKAALMPVHRWLPAAMVAPTPVSALLHAVAVVKAGVFTVAKVGVYIFGLDLLSEVGTWLVYVAGFTLLAASLVALTKDNLKERLAYSTISQLSYIVLGVALANESGILGSGMHIATHAVGKITLFFCAGAIYVGAHKTQVSQLDGLGRTMPFTMGAFGLASLSIIGLPPLGGAWSKWFLALGSVEAQHWPLLGALMISSLLNIGYLMPVTARAFFRPPREAHESKGTHSEADGIREAPVLCVVPLCVTAVGCVMLFFGAGWIHELLQPLRM